MAGGSAYLVLLDAIVPTAAFGIVCLASLRSRRPLIHRFALDAIGADTARGRAFAGRWRHPAFRRAFRFATVVWGVAFLGETGAQLAIIQTASTAAARTTANLLPLAVTGLVAAWNVAYARRGRRPGAAEVTARRPPPARAA